MKSDLVMFLKYYKDDINTYIGRDCSMQPENIRIISDCWEDRANNVLSHFNFSYPDEIDLYDICWRFGIKIKPLDRNYMDNGIDYESIEHLKAFSTLKSTGRRGTIYLQPGLYSIEKKLLLAEEFCHLYSHCQQQLSVSEYELEKVENQAKRMAAYLIMPESFLRNVLNFAIDEPVLISDIADYFVVTEEFAHYRMKLKYHRNLDALFTLQGKLGTLEWL